MSFAIKECSSSCMSQPDIPLQSLCWKKVNQGGGREKLTKRHIENAKKGKADVLGKKRDRDEILEQTQIQTPKFCSFWQMLHIV